MSIAIIRILSSLILILGIIRANAQSAKLGKPKIDTILTLLKKEMRLQHIPGLSISVLQNADLTWGEGLGITDIENNVPTSSYSEFRTASIAKMFTAVAVMQLVERGLIDLDKPIDNYCPEFGRKKWPITTRQLLQHQSGVRSYHLINDKEDSAELYSTKHYNDVLESLEIFKNDSLLFKPGTNFHYTSYGYVLLGCIIQKVSGVKYSEYMKKSIFEAAGMYHTFPDEPQEIVANRSRGYYISKDGKLHNSVYVDMSNKMAAGGFLTTSNDLILFTKALLNKKLINSASLNQMFSIQIFSDGDVVNYGYGCVVNNNNKDFYNLTEVLHGGGTPGVSNLLYILPEKRFAIAILANREDIDDRVDIARNIARIYLNLK